MNVAPTTPGHMAGRCFARCATLKNMTGSPTLPPDRSNVRTEHRHPRSTELDTLDTQSFIQLMAEDHHAVTRAVIEAGDALASFIDAIVPRMRDGGRLIYAGAGTSGRLGVLDASECPPTFHSEPGQVVGIIAGGDSALRTSSEGKEDEPDGSHNALMALSLNRHDAVLGIAAGGTTPYALGSLRLAKSITNGSCMTGLLTCAPPLQPPEHCDHLIALNTGPEVLTGSTRLKAGSGTKLALNIISTAVFTQLGKVYSNLMVDLKATNEKLTDRAIRILVELCPELSREQAAAMLCNAGGHLKTALVMQRLDVDRDAALDLLALHDGNLRRILPH